MIYTDKHNINTYTQLFEGLSFHSKIELIESLTKYLKNNETSFYSTFGALESDISAEEMISDLRLNRSLKNIVISFAQQ